MSGYRILVVDDDPSTHEILGEYLSNAGLTMISAADGAEGLALMKKKRPDVVLLDIQMPVMDGMEALAAIQGDPTLEDTPVLFLTNLDRGYLKVKGLELGAQDYIIKPFDKAELLARIKVALRRSARYHRANASLHGNLADLSLPELLQTFELGNKDASLALPDIDGEIVMVAGRLVHARQGAFIGSRALERIFYLERGAFTVDFGEAANDRTLEEERSVSAVMRILPMVDEARRAAADLPPPETVIEAAGERSGDDDLAALIMALPTRLDDAVAHLPGSLEENVATLRDALGGGRLRAADGGPPKE